MLEKGHRPLGGRNRPATSEFKSAAHHQLSSELHTVRHWTTYYPVNNQRILGKRKTRIRERRFCHTWPRAEPSTTASTRFPPRPASGCYSSTRRTGWPSTKHVQYGTRNGRYKRTYTKTGALTFIFPHQQNWFRKFSAVLHTGLRLHRQLRAQGGIACQYQTQSYFTDFLSNQRKSKLVTGQDY